MTTTGDWTYYRKAYNFLGKNDDSAFYYFNRSATNSVNKQQIAAAYQSMALIQSNAGDNYGAQESLILSLKSLSEQASEDRNYLARAYNGLGMTYSNLNVYDQALDYYLKALPYADDTALRANILNNQGNAYKDSKLYDRALSSYQAAISLTNRTGIIFARALTNWAITRWLKDPVYNAANELLTSLRIRTSAGDMAGENSSYAHLAEFYSRRKPDSAVFYARKMLTIAGALRNADDELYALRRLIALSSREQSKAYFERYQRVEDSAEIKRSAAKNQFAVIRYNVEKAKAENLQLQKKDVERQYQLIAVLAATGLAAILSVWFFRKRKKRMRLEATQEIRESRLKFSQKVHDQVANGIYRIMSEVEHTPELPKDDLLDKLDGMYNISRNIAHEEDELTEDFNERISILLNAFKRSSIRLATTGNEAALWARIAPDAKRQLEIVLQEIMVNMNKHSKATQARVGFKLEESSLKIDYNDNGVGMSAESRQGKGLRNTVSRITTLGGSVTFDWESINGFCIHIQIPVS